MITELISVGTEILLGNIVNTNSAYLSEKCALLGLSVYYQDVVGDNEGRMRDVIRTALDRSDVVILTGGLGPTEDDITKEVTADLMGMPLKEDSHSRKLIDLDACLEMMDYREYAMVDRKTLLEILIQRGLFPQAMSVVEAFGFEGVEERALLKLVSRMIDHGHYQSGISFLCGACDPQADGDQCPQEMCYRFPGG